MIQKIKCWLGWHKGANHKIRKHKKKLIKIHYSCEHCKKELLSIHTMTETLKEKIKEYLFNFVIFLAIGLFFIGIIWLSTYRYRECRAFKHSILYCVGR